MVQFCSLTIPEAQKIPASHSLINRSNRGPTVFSAIRIASPAHWIDTAARRAAFDVAARRFAGLDIALPPPHRALVGFPIFSIIAARNAFRQLRGGTARIGAARVSDLFLHPPRSTDHTLSRPIMGRI